MKGRERGQHPHGCCPNSDTRHLKLGQSDWELFSRRRIYMAVSVPAYRHNYTITTPYGLSFPRLGPFLWLTKLVAAKMKEEAANGGALLASSTQYPNTDSTLPPK
jgi:hypothetical protein